jgi:imidazolonepropionase-like amidohydrolase
MMGWQDAIGQIKEGFHADVVVLNKNPLEDVTVFDRPEEHVLGVMKDGRVYKSRWNALLEDSQIPVRVQ